MTQANTTPSDRPPFPTIRTVSIGRPLHWLKLAWADLTSCPGASLFYGFCFVAGGGLMIAALGWAPEYIAAVTSGFLIGGPFLAIGLYEIDCEASRERIFRVRAEKSRIPPLLTTAVLEPEYCRRDIWSYLCSKWGIHRLSRLSGHEYFNFILLVSDRSLIQAALHPIVSNFLANDQRICKLGL